MAVYLILAAAILALRNRLPRRYYIVLMVLLHILLCGLRHPHLTGDLMKYHWLFVNGGEWGKNPGFDLWMRLFSYVFQGNFQLFLLVTGAVPQLAVGYVLERYCPRPWLGLLAWNCLGFFLGGFSAIKQALAMGLVLLAYRGIEEGNPRRFLIPVLAAGCIHLPALILLPAYLLTRFRFDRTAAVGYLLTGLLLWCFREQAADYFTGLYYGELSLNGAGGPGGRFFLMVLMLIAGGMLRGWKDARFGRLCHLMAVAALLQMLGVYGNLFTRLADYYFQFSILFLPMLGEEPEGAVLPFDAKSRAVIRAAVAWCLVGFYWVFCLNVPIAYETDNYLRYRFFWQER